VLYETIFQCTDVPKLRAKTSQSENKPLMVIDMPGLEDNKLILRLTTHNLYVDIIY